jgi:polyferredoxin/tetratricopeptide (TPR) repeat protein
LTPEYDLIKNYGDASSSNNIEPFVQSSNPTMKSGCEDKQEKTSRRSRSLPVLQTTAGGANKVRASRTAKWRAAALIGVNLLMAIHIIQWAVMGLTVSPIEPSEAMYTIQNGYVNAGAIFFGLAILATLIFGRFVCGWACHVVSLQDLCAWMLKKVGLTPKPFRSRLLVYVPLIVALYMFVWPSVLRWLTKPKAEPVFPQFTNHLMTTEFWATFPPIAVAIPFLFICGFMTVYFLGSKGFCTYGCPYGGFFGVADKVAPGRIRVTDACNSCGHCTAVCTSNVIVHAEVAQHGMVVDPGCMKCMDCVSVCPNDALYFGFGKPAVASEGTIKRTFSMTWPEEIFAAGVFAASYFAVWNVYQLIPMLMALGIASVTTFVAVKAAKMLRSSDNAFYRFSLRSGGTTTRAGWLFIAFATFWIGLNAHSGAVRYFERASAKHFESMQIPDELALARIDPSPWLTPSDKVNVAEGRERFAFTERISLFTNKEAISKSAWLDYLAGDAERAIAKLDDSAELQSGQAKAISRYYRGAILNRMNRPQEALADLEIALAERGDMIVALEEKGEALWRLGRTSEAIETWGKATILRPELVLANNLLAGAYSAVGDDANAVSRVTQAEKLLSGDAYFNWMIAMRLQNVGFDALADRYYRRAIQIDSSFRDRRR